MNKLEMKLKRLEILKQIDAQELKRCAKCHRDVVGASDLHCGCHAATKIRNLGAEYEGIASFARQTRLDVVKAEVRKYGLTSETYRKMREMEVSIKEIKRLSQMPTLQFDDWRKAFGDAPRKENNLYVTQAAERVEAKGITLEAYARHKNQGMRDEDIQKEYDLGKNDLYKFKIKNGIVGTLGRQGRPKRSEENLIYIRRAEKNGINLETYQSRIRGGMSREVACTRPSRPKPSEFNLSVEDYKRFREEGLLDREIADNIGVSLARVARFKKKHDLVLQHSK